MYIDVSNDQSRDDKSLIGIEFDPREYFVAYLTLSPRRLAKWINRQRRLDKVKAKWRAKATGRAEDRKRVLLLNRQDCVGWVPGFYWIGEEGADYEP